MKPVSRVIHRPAPNVQNHLHSVSIVSLFVAMLAFDGVSVLAWTEMNAVSASKDDVVWIPKEYGSVGQYDSIDTVMQELAKAIEAEKRGEWRKLFLVVTPDYNDCHTIAIRGERPENAVEKAMRLKDLVHRDQLEREQYERLKEKFDGPVK